MTPEEWTHYKWAKRLLSNARTVANPKYHKGKYAGFAFIHVLGAEAEAERSHHAPAWLMRCIRRAERRAMEAANQ